MAFWGVHLEPGKSHIHRYDKNKGKLRISQATLGIGCSTDITGVQCSVGDKSPILLCAFFPTKTLSSSLDLMFEEEDDVVFSVRGPRSVYLSGFYIGNSRYEDVIESKKLEVRGDRGTRKKRKHDTANQVEEEKKFVDADHVSNKDDSEVNKTRKMSEAQESDKNRYEDVIENKKLEVGGDRGTRKKRKHDTAIQAGEEKKFVDADHVSNKDDSEVNKTRKMSEAQESDKNAKRKDEEQKVSTVETEDNKDAKREDVEEQKVSNVETEVIKDEVKALQVRTFSNGLVIEDLEYGDPDSKKAHPGSKVSVFYTGKTKSGDVFDTNVGGAPYKFKLGLGEVMKGWDVGLNGMRVGDKRRLTIPPKMGYNAKGLVGKVPNEIWQIFEVEVVGVV